MNVAKHLPPTVAAVIGGVTSIPATYAVLRVYDVLFKSEPNPATVVWSAHIAMFWRLGVGAYVAGMVAPLVFVLAKRDLPRTMRGLYAFTLVAATMSAVQGAVFP